MFTEDDEDISPKDQDGCTPFHLAASNGHASVCEVILDYIKNKNPKNKRGTTPLHMAARNGHLSTYQLIMEQVDDINPKGVIF